MTDTITIKIPDIGGATDVDVIEIYVKPGDTITVDQSLITLEGDKATMDIPSPASGIVETLMVKVGDKVSQGSAILSLKSSVGTAETPLDDSQEHAAPTKIEENLSSSIQSQEITKEVAFEKESSSQMSSFEKGNSPQNSTFEKGSSPQNSTFEKGNTPQIPPFEKGGLGGISISPNQKSTDLISAGPAVRRLAREFGIDLSLVSGHGRKSRITLDDLKAYAKSRMADKPVSGGTGIPPIPAVDFSQFGAIESNPLSKIKRLTGFNLHRAWINVPHVTQFDEADITELEIFRKQESAGFEAKGYKLTLLAFVTKAICHALQVFPQFNASLDPGGEHLIYKKYYHIGIAVETPNGLVVPVIKNADQLSVAGIAEAMSVLSQKARQKALTPLDMSGGCFTISSLGGIGGTAFTPIVNAPEVAILGLSRSSQKPVYQQGVFVPRLMLPLSLSYDHRVIDGAEAARFTQHLAWLLSDFRRVLL